MHLRAILFLLPFLVSFSGYSSILNEDIGRELTRQLATVLDLKSSGKKAPSTFLQTYDAACAAVQSNLEEALDLITKIKDPFELPLQDQDKNLKLYQKIRDERNQENFACSIHDAGNVLELLKAIPTITFPCPQNDIKKARRHLGKAVETLRSLEVPLMKTKTIIREAIPSYSDKTYLKTARILIALAEWKNYACTTPSHRTLNEFLSPQFIQTLLQHISQTGSLRFIQYICPHVVFSKLFSDQPEEYYEIKIEGSLLQMQISSLFLLVEKYLAPTGVPIYLTALIGDHDDRTYIFPFTNKKTTLDPDKLSARQKVFSSAVQDFLSSNLPSAKIDIHSISDHLETTSLRNKVLYDEVRSKIQENLAQYFTQEDIQLEQTRMRELFQPGGYYGQLMGDNELEDRLSKMVETKFASYAVDGLIGAWITTAPFFYSKVKILLYSLMELKIIPHMEATSAFLESVSVTEYSPIEILTNFINTGTIPQSLTSSQTKNLLELLFKKGILPFKEPIEKKLEEEVGDLSSREILDTILTHFTPPLPLLLQTEFPEYLRTKMLSTLVRIFFGIKFSTVYPFKNNKNTDKVSVSYSSSSLRDDIPWGSKSTLILQPSRPFKI